MPSVGTATAFDIAMLIAFVWGFRRAWPNAREGVAALMEYRREVRAGEREADPAVETLARGRARAFVLLLGAVALIGVLGVVLALSPPATPGQPLTVLGLAVSAVSILVVVAVVGAAEAFYRTRIDVLDVLRAEAAHDGRTVRARMVVAGTVEAGELRVDGGTVEEIAERVAERIEGGRGDV